MNLSSILPRPRKLTVTALAACLLATAACGGGSGDTPATQQEPRATVRLALDWVPNTNHAGFYLAKAKGLYEKAGIDLRILPYSDAPSDTVVSAGQAECGVTAPPFASISIAKGGKETIVMPVVQKPLGSLAVLADSKYQRPADLDGATYGGFGSAGDEELIKAIIRQDGGKGDFTYVNLTSGTTEALFAGRVDFINAYVNNQPILAELRDKPLRVFPYADFGIPSYPGVVVACNNEWLEQNGDTAKRFVAASADGWEAAQADPESAAQTLIDENPGGFATDEAKEAQRRSLAKMAADGLIVNEQGRAGCLAVDQLDALGKHLTEIGFYEASGVDPAPDFTKIATSAYQPEACATS